MVSKNLMVISSRKRKKAFIKLTVTPDLVERLDLLAEKFGKRSAQQIIEEVLEFYLPVWSEVERSVRRAIDLQTKALTAELTEEADESPQLVLAQDWGEANKDEDTNDKKKSA